MLDLVRVSVDANTKLLSKADVIGCSLLGNPHVLFELDFDGKKSKTPFSKNKHTESPYFVITNKIPSRKIDNRTKIIIVDFESDEKKDFVHHRRSGLDIPTAKIMKEKNIAYGADLHLINSASKQSEYIGRVVQNLLICAKYDVDIVIFSGAKNEYGLRDPKDISGFLRGYGCNQRVAKQAVSRAQKLYAELLEKRDPSYIDDGIRMTK